MVGGFAVGGEVLHGAAVVELGADEVVGRGGMLVDGGVGHHAHAGGAVGVLEVDVVGVGALVYDAAHHAAPGVGLLKAEALVYFGHARGFAGCLEVGVRRTCHLQGTHRGQGGYLFHLVDGECHKGKTVAAAQHLYAGSGEFGLGAAVGQAHHAHHVVALDAQGRAELLQAAAVG